MAKILSTYEKLSEDTQGLIHDFAREIKPSDLVMPIRKAFIDSRLKYAEAKDKGDIETISKLKEKFWIKPNLALGAYIWVAANHDFNLKLCCQMGAEDAVRMTFCKAQVWVELWSDTFRITKKLEELSGSKDPVKLAKSVAYQKEVKRELNWDISHWRL